MPEDVPGTGFLDFRTKTMRALFDRGLADGASGQGWRGTLYKPAKR